MIETLQSSLRWLFMRVEALFNRAFGDRLNPWYHLGAISFYLFWIVAATGVYLFVFFDTSVTGAYRSVESMTHDQWFAGGVMRSVHRYASDAMAMTMLIHMTRYFAFNRLRGFRWFSWVTGVVLIGLFYAAGINGYMLPWDQLAQFVTTTTFEWLDWLPTFGGLLGRNFIYDEKVSNRLFSLLVFIHIGVPLLLLLVMWVHVQRVPKASTQPPRPIALSVMVMLLVLAIVLPVASQGGAARMAVAPTTLRLDWFLLALYPLVYVASPAALWTTAVGLAALLLVLPWVPWRHGRGRNATMLLTVHPGAQHIPVRSGETLLEAGLRAGIPLAFDCRSGACGLCRCTVLNGRVEHGAYQPSALTQAMRAHGEALMCCAVPLEDVEIDVEELPGVAGSALAPFDAQVVRMERLSADVMMLTLAPPEGHRIDFVAGQYLNVLLDDGERRAFSFANAPHNNELIELHVRLIPGGRFTTHVFTHMKVGDAVRLEGPFGQFVLHDSRQPILFIAGATGFAPIKSIVEDAFARGLKRPMWLYWGVRKRGDLYALDLAQQWQREHANFHFVPVLSEPDPQDGWTGRTGLVHEAMLADFPDLREHEVYVCGSVKMVEAAVPAFLAQGLGEGFCFTDAFAPSGRPTALQERQ